MNDLVEVNDKFYEFIYSPGKLLVQGERFILTEDPPTADAINNITGYYFYVAVPSGEEYVKDGRMYKLRHQDRVFVHGDFSIWNDNREYLVEVQKEDAEWVEEVLDWDEVFKNVQQETEDRLDPMFNPVRP